MPKLLFLLPLSLLLTSTAHAIEHYRIGDTLFVWANSGLTLRAKPDFKSEKITLLPYGTAVIAESEKYRYAGEKDHAYVTEIPASKDFPGLKIPGRWLPVTAGNLLGFVFDGYLSHLPPFQIINPQGERERTYDYACRVWGLAHKQITNSDSHGDDSLFVFKNGATCNTEVGEGGGSHSWQIPNISFEEGFLMFMHGNSTELKEWEREEGVHQTLELNEVKGYFMQLRIDKQAGWSSMSIFRWMPGIFVYESGGWC